MDLQTQLISIVKEALPHLDNDQAGDIVGYLMSENVGVVSLDDLKDLELELMPPTLPPLKQRQLFNFLKKQHQAALQSVTGGGGGSASGTCETPETSQRRPLAPISTNFSSDNVLKFQFKVVWNDMPQTTLKNLDEASRANKPASPIDMAALKLAISKKVVTSYLTFRQANPGSKLSPGRAVYKNLTKQVFAKYKDCFKITVNGKVIGDGTHTLVHLFEVCIENLLRKERERNRNRAGLSVSAKKGKGLVGVNPNEYEPRAINQDEQQGIKAHLQNYYLLNNREQDLQQVSKDLTNTYEIQRADIIAAKEEVLQVNDENNEEGADDSGLNEPALKKLLREWPFLFRPEMMRAHHNRLTGRDIHLEISKFVQEKLEALINYMTTCSNSNIANLALRMDAERAVGVGRLNKLIMALMMVANHFKDDYTNLIFTVERTMPLDEIDVQETDPCIVAFGHDPLLAEKFVVCADKTPLIQCDNEVDAVTSLFEACFVFDLEYPKLPLTVEFFERMVFSMGFADTRVENKKGKTILTLTDGVKRLINGLQSFEEQMAKQRERGNKI